MKKMKRGKRRARVAMGAVQMRCGHGRLSEGAWPAGLDYGAARLVKNAANLWLIRAGLSREPSCWAHPWIHR